jgi:hypothetical protein
LTTPYPSDAATRRLGDATQPPTSAAPTGAAPPPPPRAARQRIPGLRRRLALLAATLYMPVILLGYALYLHGPTDCVAGPLCSLGDAPALAQALFIALGFGLLYLIGVRPLAALLDERQPARSEVARTLRQAARYETIRPLLAIFGALIALLLLVGFVARTLNLPAIVIGAGIAALLLWLAANGEP